MGPSLKSSQALRDYHPSLGDKFLLRTAGRGTLPKVAYANEHQPRLLFIAGLEGSGHHLWDMVFSECQQQSAAEQCRFTTSLANRLSDGKHSSHHGSGLFDLPTRLVDEQRHIEEPHTPWARQFDAAKQRVRNALRREVVNNSGLLVLNSLHSSASMLSYPNFGGTYKILQTPDVRELAEVCEEEVVDLRILVLHRPAASLLSSTSRRQFETWNHEAVILEHNAQALNQQLSQLDPAFVLCVDTTKLPALPEDLQAFLFKNSSRQDRAGQNAASAARDALPISQMIRAHFRPSRTIGSIPDGKALGLQLLDKAVTQLAATAHCSSAVDTTGRR